MKVNKFSESNLEQDLLRCDFEKITEDQIPDYTGDEEDDLSSYISDGVYDFGYLGYDDFYIVHLDISNGDDVLRNKNGSNDFIIKYNNEIYMGSFNEGENIIGENDEYMEDVSEDFCDFKKEMIKQNLEMYYCVSF